MKLPLLLLCSFVPLFWGCSRDRLVGADDPACNQPCYEGAGRAGVGACSWGVWSCVNGEVVACVGQGHPSTEICDGIDNDCNGTVDAFPDTCSTPCGIGFHHCTDGAWESCSAPTPKPETCNNFDDDCDGQVDEQADLPVEFCYTGPASTVSKGVCHPGIYQCVDGIKVCINEVTPSPETCNHLDDDCNGSTDEGLGGSGIFDFVFVIDNSGSMISSIGKVNNAVTSFSQTYQYDGRFAFALVKITDEKIDGKPFVAQDFTDAGGFAQAVSSIRLDEGGAYEASYDAVVQISDLTNPLKLSWRTGALKYIVLITDEDGQSYTNPSNTEASTAKAAKMGGVKTYIFTIPSSMASFDDIAAASGGKVYNLSATGVEIENWLSGIIAVGCPI